MTHLYQVGLKLIQQKSTRVKQEKKQGMRVILTIQIKMVQHISTKNIIMNFSTYIIFTIMVIVLIQANMEMVHITLTRV